MDEVRQQWEKIILSKCINLSIFSKRYHNLIKKRFKQSARLDVESKDAETQSNVLNCQKYGSILTRESSTGEKNFCVYLHFMF